MPMRRRAADLERLEEGRQQRDERQQVSGLGLRRGCSLRRAPLPRGQTLPRQKTAKTNSIVATEALAHELARATFHVLRDQQPVDAMKVFG
jgi:hypothetical protein